MNDPGYDKKWGRFTPEKRLNVDQALLCQLQMNEREYMKLKFQRSKGEIIVCVSQPGSGLDKRQCTLQVAFGSVTKDVKIAIIFRGTGKKNSKDETEAYHESVDIYWQKNAWADTNFSVEWVKGTHSPAV